MIFKKFMYFMHAAFVCFVLISCITRIYWTSTHVILFLAFTYGLGAVAGANWKKLLPERVGADDKYMHPDEQP